MTERTLQRLDWIIAKAELGRTKLRTADMNFLGSIAARRADWGDRLRLTDPQWEWLEDIEGRSV